MYRSKRRRQPEFGKIDAPAKDLHRSKRRRQPEFGKVDVLSITREKWPSGFAKNDAQTKS